MPHAASPLGFAPFGSAGDPLMALQETAQGQYLRWYLADLGAQSVLTEPTYFDCDFLSEFAAFYCTSSAGYENTCRRVHYFSEDVTRTTMEAATAEDADACRRMQTSYLGFVVLRPIPNTPIGRTVLRWYQDRTPLLPRVVDPSREYAAHVAGLTLSVRGLAWQQQDGGVGACATVALWTMLHSAAFDDRHVIPTTADVTRAAHGAGLSAYRAFPSQGLNFGQLVATLRDSGFAPLVVPGDRRGAAGSGGDGFTREHFSSSLAALVRSGYPVLFAGSLIEAATATTELGRHSVCTVGFRQASSPPPTPGRLAYEDAQTVHIYVHDDNLGPSARFRIEEDPAGNVVLRADPPPAVHTLSLPDPTVGFPRFRPSAMLAAAHEDVRVSPDALHSKALHIGTTLIATSGGKLGLSASARIARIAHYVERELATVLASDRTLLGRVRLELWEKVPPMSLHIGVVRFGAGSQPLLDVLFDTSDSEPNFRAFCHLAYHPAILALTAHAAKLVGLDLGVRVAAF